MARELNRTTYGLRNQKGSYAQRWFLSVGFSLLFTIAPTLAATSNKKDQIQTKPMSTESDLSVVQGQWAFQSAASGNINFLSDQESNKSKKIVKVAVIDTGIDANHPLLKGSLLNFNGSNDATVVDYGKDFSFGNKNDKTPNDEHGHGTHIAGIIKSVHPDVKIIAIKYYNPSANEKNNLDSTIKSLEYAISLGVDIINYSSGGAGASLEELRALKKAESKGILVVTAAGNFGSNIDVPSNRYYPASYNLQNIISVINHDQDLEVNPTSNFGANTADISAPGSRIKSSMPFGKLGFLSGTSQSTAFVSGVAAKILSLYPEATFSKVKEIIRLAARQHPNLKDKCKSGGALDFQNTMVLARQIFNGTSRERLLATKESASGQKMIKAASN